MHLGSEGESFSLPDFAASFNSSTGDISGFFDESMEGQQEEIISEEDVLVDIPEEEALADVLSGPAWKMSATISSQDEGGQSDFDFTYLSPSFGGKYGLPPGNSVLQNNPEGAGKFLGSSAADGRGSNDIMESLSILPDGRSGAGVSHSFKSPTNPRDEIQFNSITAKEPLKDIIKQEDMETERAFFASSPPFIPSQNKSSGATPRNKRTHETDVSGSSASRRKTAHRTPSLARIREASEVISDGLDADESMAMAEQDVGVGFGGPPTPESQEQYPPLGAMADDADSSYPSLLDLSNQPEVEVLYPSLDPTGIPSPPLSQAAVLTTTGYIGQILPPFKNSEPIKPVTASTAPTAPPTNTSRVPRTRSVHLEDETSLDARVREFDRVVMLETKWAREREENIQRARGMKVISIDETDEDRAKALLEDWERERTLVRKQARETGAITIDDTEEENTTARDTAGPSTTRSAEPRTDNTTLVSVSKRGMAIPSSNIIAPTTGHSVLQDSILDDIDITIATSSGLTWTKENYKRLSTILVSKSTDPKTCKKRYSVQLDRPARLLSTEVLTLLDLDADGYLRLSTTESAAVDRFCRREKAFGRDWKKTEVVRRVAGLRVADVRARVVGRRKRK